MTPLEAFSEEFSLTDEQRRYVEEAVAQNTTYEQAFIDLGFTDDDVRQFYATQYGVPAYSLPKGFSINQDILKYIPEESAFHYQIAPLMVQDGILIVGANKPDDLQMREALNFISNRHSIGYKIVFLLQKDIQEAIDFYSNLEGDVTDVLSTLESEADKELAAELKEVEEEKEKEYEHIQEDAPVTKIVATILRYAVDGGASDIHIEPTGGKVKVRFRVDGVLATSLELPRNMQMAVVARVKILSAMRLDEKRKPQDGRFSATFNQRKIDFRVSVLPTNHGEKVVMRILDNEQGVHTLEGTGIADYNLDILRRLIDEPYGIILISGPTGSGKSTTLYGMLGELDRTSKNVLSLEDPVEYNIDGVSQSQVRPEIGYTFADGLRAALRQDPDIIMVGEIRDRETAQLAVQAALTGHLVLSTIHTNNSIGVVPRLLDMGIDPYLIAPTLKCAIAQRLARRLVPGTGEPEPISRSTQMMIDEAFRTLPERYHNRIPKSDTIMRPKPSPESATGMQGRTAIMEVMKVDDEIQELILRRASEEEMFTAVRKKGFMTMQEDAIIKALTHVIPFEEMNSFSTTVGGEMVGDTFVDDVDNPPKSEEMIDIMDSNEVTSG